MTGLDAIAYGIVDTIVAVIQTSKHGSIVPVAANAYY